LTWKGYRDRVGRSYRPERSPSTGRSVKFSLVTGGPAPESTGAQPDTHEPRPERTAEIAGANIVVLGDLNPAILQPSWLARHDLLRPAEADAAEVQIVSRELTVFTTDWLEVGATPERLQVASTSAPSNKLVRDLTVGIFRLLEHTPVRAAGINHHYHFREEDKARRDQLGDRLAPKELWTNILLEPGTRSLIMQGLRPDDYAGNLTVQVEPSIRLPGVYIAVNDHFQLDQMDMATAQAMVDILESEWDASDERAQTITTHLMSAL
jgi:hypothetical protein